MEQYSGWKVRIIGSRCYRCHHSWKPININQKPKTCPKCNSPYWDKPRKNVYKNNKGDQ